MFVVIGAHERPPTVISQFNVTGIGKISSTLLVYNFIVKMQHDYQSKQCLVSYCAEVY